MTRNRPPSPQTTAVLLALAGAPAEWHHGYQLCQRLNIQLGSMYPILMRLADRGLLETAWEPAGQPAGRPPRHLYRLSPAGLELARSLGLEMTARAAKPRPLRPREAGA